MKKIVFLIIILLCVCINGYFFDSKSVQSNLADIDTKPDVINLASGRHLAPGEKDAYYCSRILEVWEPLITRDENNKPIPCLAESWSSSNNAKVWTFKLRKDVIFHDGSKFNADAVIKNFDRMKMGIKRSIFYSLDINTFYPSLKEYKKLDDYTVQLIFNEPNTNLLYKMIDFGSPIYAPSCLADDGNFKGIAIGTGPFKIVDNVLNKYVKLERFEQYYGSKAKEKSFIIKNIPSVDVRYSALKSGEIYGVIDINAIAPVLAEELKEDNRFGVSANKSTMIRFLALNGHKYPFNDVRMRRAISLAIDRDSLVKSLYAGYAVPTANLLNYASPYYKDYPIKYDVKEAKRLAKEVLGDKRYEVIYCINGKEPIQKGEAELIAYWLKEIGLDVKIQSMEYATMAHQVKKGDFNIARLQQGLPNGDPYNIFYSFMMKDGARNINNSLGYENSEVQDLLQVAKYTENESLRQSIYEQLQKISVDDQPIIPLFNDMNIVAYNKHLKNYQALVYGVDLSQIEWSDNYE